MEVSHEGMGQKTVTLVHPFPARQENLQRASIDPFHLKADQGTEGQDQRIIGNDQIATVIKFSLPTSTVDPMMPAISISSQPSERRLPAWPPVIISMLSR